MFHRVISESSIDLIHQASEAKLAVMYRKTLLKFKKCNNHLWFLSSCIKSHVVPTHMKIRCHHNSWESKKAVEHAYTYWIHLEMKEWYSRRYNLNVHLKVIHTELAAKIHPLIFDILDSDIREEVQIEAHRQYEAQVKKLNRLIGKCSPGALLTDISQSRSSNHKFNDRVVNLTNVEFKKEHLDLLNKGLKYSPNYTTRKDIETLGVDVEIALSSVSDNQTATIKKYQISSIIQDRKSNPPNIQEQKCIKEIKSILNQNNLILTKADKGNSITIIEKSVYIDKTLKMIAESQCEEVKNDPTSKFQTALLKTLKDCSNIFSQRDIYFLKVMNPKSPDLYSLPKIHKSNVPMRPVVSFINAPTYKLCSKLSSVLPEITNFKSEHSIKNSIDLITKIEPLHLPPSAKLVSFDVKSLFTSVPVKELKQILKDLVSNSSLNNQAQTELLSLLNICIEQNYFSFNNKFYIQKDGLPMGSPLSPWLTEVYMNHFEGRLFNSNNHLIRNIVCWHRYVDDVFCIWTGSTRQLDNFLNFLNSLNPNIQFTLETENNDQLNFLDLTITRINNKLKFGIYRKPTTSDTIIPFDSSQSHQIKMAALHSLTHRLLSIPLSEADYNTELNIIKSIASNNGYSASLIDTLVRKKQRKKIIQKVYTANKINSEPNRWTCLNYIPKISNKISNSLNGLNFKIIQINKNNLGRLLVNNKLGDHKENRSGVYEVKCKECDAIYVGQSGRNISIRIKEHVKSIEDRRSSTGFAEHCISNGHSIDQENYKVLHVCNKGRRLNLLEELEIKKAIKSKKHVTNDITNFSSSPILEALVNS